MKMGTIFQKFNNLCEGTKYIWMVFGFIFFITTLVLTGTLLYLIILNPDIKFSQEQTKVVIEKFRESKSNEIADLKLTATNVFSELTTGEINTITSYLLKDHQLNLVPANEATTLDNYIYMMEVLDPNKTDTLLYLNSTSRLPPRRALVLLMVPRRRRDPPRVYEIIFEFEPEPRWMPYKYHDWSLRPRLAPPEVKAMDQFLKKKNKPLEEFFIEKFGFGFSDCTSKCLTWTYTAPPIPKKFSGIRTRNTWIHFRQPYPGPALHAVPLYLLVQDKSPDPEKWFIEKVFYKNTEFNVREMFPEPIPETFKNEEKLASKMDNGGPRELPRPSTGPKTVGKGRYKIENERISYFNWDFTIRHKISTGLQLLDVRFKSFRILYELSVQGIMSFYSGANPYMMHARFLEDLQPLGFSTNKLIRDLDCPSNADYLNGTYYSPHSGKAETLEDYICIFEHDTDLPIKRHRSEKYHQFSGMLGVSLVIRTIQTFRETDFIFDYVLYNNGALETKFYTTGYPLGTFWSKTYKKEKPFGYPVSENQLSPIATHLVNYKVDLDVFGTSNRHETNDIEYYSNHHYYFQEEEIMERKITKKLKQSEHSPQFDYDFEKPKFLLFYNQKFKNKFGKPKAYRLELDGIAKNLEPVRQMWENGVAWARHQVTLTKYRENERRSSSMFNGMDPYEPTVHFQTFLYNNDNLVDEDLVAWVTVGNHRLPSTTDVPLASTLDTNGGFKLLPFNYFDQDPSKSHPDWIYKAIPKTKK